MCAALSSAVVAVPNSGGAIESSDALTAGFVLERLAGANRFDTSAMAAKAAFPDGSTDVVVARAFDAADDVPAWTDDPTVPPARPSSAGN